MRGALGFFKKYYLYSLEDLSFFKLLTRMSLLYMPLALLTTAYIFAKHWPLAHPVSLFILGAHGLFLLMPAGLDLIHWSVPAVMSRYRTSNNEKNWISYAALTVMKTLWMAAAVYSIGFLDVTLKTNRELETIRLQQCEHSRHCADTCQLGSSKFNLKDIIDCEKRCDEAAKYCNQNYFRKLME